MSLKEVVCRVDTAIREKICLNVYKPGCIFKIDQYCKSVVPKYFLGINKNNPRNYRVDDEQSDAHIDIYDIQIPLANINWHYDYKNDISYPVTHLSDINLADYEDVEIKCNLELHRFQYLTKIAFKYYINKDEESLLLITNILHSWLDEIKFGYGLVWKSGIGTAIRLVSWILIWQLIDFNTLQEKYVDLKKQWLDSIEKHLFILSYLRSQHSSANNHLTAEITGIYIGMCFFSSLLKDQSHIDNYQNILERLIQEQNCASGVNREAAFGYMYEVTDYFLINYFVSIHSGKLFSVQYLKMLRKMVDYISSSLDSNNNFCDYGDRDDGHLIDVSLKEYNCFVSLCNSAAILFQNLDWIKSDKIDERNYMLFGDGANFLRQQAPQNRAFSKHYDDAGHVIYKSEDSAILFHFKAGYLGYLSIAAHGHSDLLSFYLSVDGIPVFIDPGTYCYRYNRKYREYFRSSMAHNTIRINHKNQSRAYGPNHWCKNVKADMTYYKDLVDRIEIKSEFVYDEGEVHARDIIIKKNAFELNIIDTIKNVPTATAGYYEQCFHIGDSIGVSKSSDGNLLLDVGGKKRIIFQSNMINKLQLIKGQDDGFIYGWKSDSFLKKKPITSLLIADVFQESFSLETAIKLLN